MRKVIVIVRRNQDYKVGFKDILIATAIAGDVPYWIDAFLTRIERMFGDMALNLMINTKTRLPFRLSLQFYEYWVKWSITRHSL